MSKKPIPFPIQVRSSPPAPQYPNRVIVRLGEQRIAIDISCVATVLNPPPRPTVLPVRTAAKVRQPRPGGIPPGSQAE
jgi:hypothetical protein